MVQEETINRANELLLDILEKGIDGFEKGLDFASGQIPELIEQLLMWYLLSNTVTGLSISILLLFGLFLASKMINIPKEGVNNQYWTTGTSYLNKGDRLPTIKGFVTMCLSFLCIVLTPYSIYTNLMEALKIFIAPKLWLLEYAATLVK